MSNLMHHTTTSQYQIVVHPTAQSYTWLVSGVKNGIRKVHGRSNLQNAERTIDLMQKSGYEDIRLTTPRGRKIK